MTSEELKEAVIELLTWLETKNQGDTLQDSMAICGFTLTALVLMHKNPEDLAEQVIDTFRASLKEHLDRHPELMGKLPHPRRKRRTRP